MDHASKSPVSLDTGTRLALDRTFLAYERTLMAWVRTAASLISFGFTIYKFFQLELDRQAPVVDRLLGPRGFAIAMIGMGLFSLLLSTLQHRKAMQRLKVEYGPVVPSSSPAGIVAGLFAILGLLALAATVLNQ